MIPPARVRSDRHVAGWAPAQEEKSGGYLLTFFLAILHKHPTVARSRSESAPGIGRVKRVWALVEGARSMAKKKKKAAKKAAKKKKGHG